MRKRRSIFPIVGTLCHPAEIITPSTFTVHPLNTSFKGYMRASCRRLASLANKPRVSDVDPTPYSWVQASTPSQKTGKMTRETWLIKGPLAGKSIAIKENISYASAPTTCSSKVLQGQIRFRHPGLTDRLSVPLQCYVHRFVVAVGRNHHGNDQDGRIWHGVRTGLNSWGASLILRSETRNVPSYYTPVHNPAGPSSDRTPRSAGGSSGGSAAAVAEGSCDA